MAATETEAVWSVKCYCCGLTEECTPRYIDGVRERYQGRWICGLCAEAVKEEGLKLKDVNVSTDEALKRHMNFRSSTSSPPNKPTIDLILALDPAPAFHQPQGGAMSNFANGRAHFLYKLENARDDKDNQTFKPCNLVFSLKLFTSNSDEKEYNPPE
ncbi:hypothetical protein CR513_27529, partial [Mucuna pruriens]